MNKVILMGRLTRDPEVRYSQAAEPIAVVRFTIAVNKRFKREGEADADFINCVAFGKTGEFTNRYFKKGNMISVVGRISTNTWTDNNGQKRYSTEVIVEEQFFCESKAAAEASRGSYVPPAQAAAAEAASAPQPQQPPVSDSGSDSFYKVEQSVDDDDLPF